MTDRYQRLADVVSDIAWAENRSLEGRELEVMVADTSGRKDRDRDRLTGRAADNRLVHFSAPAEPVRPGDIVAAVVTRGAPHHLLADGPTRVIDQAPATSGCAVPATGVPEQVGLGIPKVR